MEIQVEQIAPISRTSRFLATWDSFARRRVASLRLYHKNVKKRVSRIVDRGRWYRKWQWSVSICKKVYSSVIARWLRYTVNGLTEARMDWRRIRWVRMCFTFQKYEVISRGLIRADSERWPIFRPRSAHFINF